MTKEEKAAYDRVYKEKNKEKIKLYNKQFYQKNRDRCIATTRKYQKDNREKVRAYQRVYYRVSCYGINKEMFDQMLKTQNNKCSICERSFDFSNKKRSPHVDHDHTTGKIRSLLCMNCNSGLGLFGENTTTLKKAIEYLASYN